MLDIWQMRKLLDIISEIMEEAFKKNMYKY